MAWTFSIEYDDDRTGKRLSTMVMAAAAARSALEAFWREHPDAEIVEVRRVRHD